MKRIFAFTFVLAVATLALSAGCAHAGQLPPTPPVYTAPPSTGTAYAPLNPPANNTTPASVTGLTYSTTPANIGTWCYNVQSWAIVAPATVYQDSVPSNTVCVTTTTADPVVDLSWNAPVGASGYTYVVSVASATLVPTPGAPTQNAPTTAADLVKPDSGSKQFAKISRKVAAPIELMAMAAR